MFDELTADMRANEKWRSVAIQLLRERKINISPFLYHNLISKCLKYKANKTQYVTRKIHNKAFFQQIVLT